MKKKPNGPVLAAGVFLMTASESPEFLLMKHPKRWDLPKGHAEAGESAIETARREMQEETGIDPREVKIDPNFKFRLEYPVTYKRWGDEVFTKRVTIFLGTIKKKPELDLTEHDGAKWFRWMPPHDIQEKTINPVLKAVAKHLVN